MKKKTDWLVFSIEDLSCPMWVNATSYQGAILAWMDMVGVTPETITEDTLKVIPVKEYKDFIVGRTVKYTLSIKPVKPE